MPYGAFELKARYQFNLLLANLLAIALVIGTTTAGWLIMRSESEAIPVPDNTARPDSTVMEIPPGFEIIKEHCGAKPPERKEIAGRIGVPVPIDDDLFVPDDAAIASNVEKAEYYYEGEGTESGPTASRGTDDSQPFYIPERDEFVKLERQPELIYQAVPAYPELARTAGQEGKVVIQALVNPEGGVDSAFVQKSSGIALLDQAARTAAFKNKFSPGIQNGTPLYVWVSYVVEFSLHR